MSKLPKLEIDVVLNSTTAPETGLNSGNFSRTVEEIIKEAFQRRLPLYEVSIKSIKANWPDASGKSGSFIGYDSPTSNGCS